MTLLELRHATVGYSDAAIRTAVVAGLGECRLPDVPADLDFADLAVFWLTDPESWEWFAPPLARVHDCGGLQATARQRELTAPASGETPQELASTGQSCENVAESSDGNDGVPATR